MEQLTISAEYKFWDIQTPINEYRVKYYGGYTHEVYLLTDGKENLLESYSNCHELTDDERKEYIKELISEHEEAYYQS